MTGPCRAGIAVALALALAGCATQAPLREPAEPAAPAATTATATPSSAPAASPRCLPGTGVVAQIRDRSSSQAGATALHGGVLGGVLGDGKPPQSSTAAVGGYDLYVRMDDGRKLIVNQRALDGIAVNTRLSIDASCRAHPAP